jgi:hypothetical protein
MSMVERDAPPRIYEVLLRDDDCSYFEGEVVTHLPLADWAVLHGYKVVDVHGWRPARALQRTTLAERPMTESGPYSFSLPAEVLDEAYRRVDPKRSGR